MSGAVLIRMGVHDDNKPTGNYPLYLDTGCTDDERQQKMSKEMIAGVYRQEELLLELVYNKLLTMEPTRPDSLDESPGVYYNGFYDGWWEAVEMLGNIISEHEESNRQKLKGWSK